MKLKAFLALGAAAAGFVLPASVQAAGSISGTSKGLSWTATSTIVGQTSTATLAPVQP